MSQGDQRTDRARLEALRDLLEARLTNPETSSRDLSAVSREYRLTVAALSGLPALSATSKRDEIAERRRKRGAAG